jgi:putative transposase
VPGKPVQNAFIESFNGSFRDECLNQHELTTARSYTSWRRSHKERIKAGEHLRLSD